jgi:hypothetical protein
MPAAELLALRDNEEIGSSLILYHTAPANNIVIATSLYTLRDCVKAGQIWPVQTVTCLHTNSPGHIWTTLYKNFL